MNSQELQSKTIDYLRFPLAIGVVFGHSFFPPFEMNSIDYNAFTSHDLAGMIRVTFSLIIPWVTVPLFYMISGYLFFNKVDKLDSGLYFTKMKSRIRSLIIPYIIWNILALIILRWDVWMDLFNGIQNPLLANYEGLGWLKSFWVDFEEIRTHSIGGDYPISTPINGPLWFIRDLIIVTILAPLVYLMVKYTRIYGMIFLFLAYFTNIWIYTPGFSIKAFSFFTFGAYLSLNKYNMYTLSQKVKLPAYILFGLSLIIGIFTKEGPYYDYVLPIFVVAGIIASINLVSDLLDKGVTKVNPFLVKSTFFIFAAHWLNILTYSRISYYRWFHPESPLATTVQYFIVPLMAVGTCLLFYFLLQKTVPKLLAFTSGGR